MLLDSSQYGSKASNMAYCMHVRGGEEGGGLAAEIRPLSFQLVRTITVKV